jgi:DNA-binding transcriptional LysR family regulator
VISYTIANLEAQLEVALFERSGARQAKLTEAGTALLEDARRILSGLEVMRARVRGLKDGLEAEVAVAISVMVPTGAMVDVLNEFRTHFPSVSLRLDVGELGEVMKRVLSGSATIGIGGALLRNDDALVTEKIGHSFMMPVAAAGHPLTRKNRPLTLTDVRDETQLVVSDSSGLTDGRTFNVLSYKTWHVGDIATKLHLLRGGLGWGGLPVSLIYDDLREGRLVKLELEAYEQGEYPLYAMHRLATPPGPAAAWMIDAFRAKLSLCPNHVGFTAMLEAGQLRPIAIAAE